MLNDNTKTLPSCPRELDTWFEIQRLDQVLSDEDEQERDPRE